LTISDIIFEIYGLFFKEKAIFVQIRGEEIVPVPFASSLSPIVLLVFSEQKARDVNKTLKNRA